MEGFKQLISFFIVICPPCNCICLINTYKLKLLNSFFMKQDPKVNFDDQNIIMI